MNLTIETNTANAGLGYIMAACEPRSTLPIMKNILIESISSDKARFTATNAEIQLSVVLPCETDGEYAITIEGRKLADIFKKLPKGSSASLSIDGNKATLKSGRSRFTLNTLPAKEYPEFQKSGEPNNYSLNGALLRDAMDKCSVSMAKGDHRVYLNGVHFSFKNGIVDVVSTDGHRMNMSTIKSEGSESSVIVPAAAVKPITAVLGDDDVTLAITSNSLSVSDTSREVTVKMIDGKYPDYMRVLPKNNKTEIEFDRIELLSALDRVGLMSNEKFKGVSLSIKNNHCSILSKNGSEGAEEVVPCGYNGEEINIGCNETYLIDALGCFNTDSIVLKFGDTSVTPILIEDDSVKCVVVPMRM